jgi:hypothetical protein
MKWKSERRNRISTKKHERNLVTLILEEALLQMKFTSTELQQSQNRPRQLSQAKVIQHLKYVVLMLKDVDSR